MLQLQPPTRPVLTLTLLLLTDFVAVLLVAVLVLWGRQALGGSLDWATYTRLGPILLLFPLVFAFLGLYPGVGVSPPEELRRSAMGLTLVYLMLGSTTFLFQEADRYSRAAFLVGWLVSLVVLPIARGALRAVLAHRPWWGVGVVVVGRQSQQVVGMLAQHPGLGLKPVAVLELEALDQARSWAQRGVRHLILAQPDWQGVMGLERQFPHLLLLPDLGGPVSLWVRALDLAGTLVLEVQQNLLRPWARRLKRGLDLTLVLLGGLLSAPLWLLVALAIRLDSPGPVLFGHQRLGQDGRRFRLWKFRTMVQRADRLLETYLTAHPDLRQEWERDHKLRHDPRLTRVGRWLRKTSLDEIPQLWNVLCGEMSLVGPRPIVEAEKEKYGTQLEVYYQVLPGMTGLWQVSGRNDTSYQQRVQLDVYYVRNWSPWLDLYLLARTVWVVLRARGAY